MFTTVESACCTIFTLLSNSKPVLQLSSICGQVCTDNSMLWNIPAIIVILYQWGVDKWFSCIYSLMKIQAQCALSSNLSELPYLSYPIPTIPFSIRTLSCASRFPCHPIPGAPSAAEQPSPSSHRDHPYPSSLGAFTFCSLSHHLLQKDACSARFVSTYEG